MKIWRFVYLGAVVSAAIIGLGVWSPLGQAIAKDPNKAPRYKVDPSWPKPLPSDTEANPAAATDGFRTTGPGASKPWVTGEVAGDAVDSQDHVFTINRGPQGNLISPETVVAHPSPAIIEFDREGNVVNAWPPNVPSSTAPWWTAPRDSVGCDGSTACHNKGVPTGLHGIFVDFQDNVWIAGNGDGIVQKYSHDGSTLLLQIGQHGVCDNPPANTCGNSGGNAAANNSQTLLNQPPNMKVDPNPDPVTGQTGSIYVPDGYGNHRVVVFDRNGRWLRHWGGVVANSANPNATAHDRGSFASGDGGHPHCMVLGNDGFLYVCDRASDRILVFEKNPTNCTGDPSVWVAGNTPVCQPVKIITVIPGTGVTAGKSDGVSKNVLGAVGSAWDLAFSKDEDQSFFFEVDGSDEIVWEFDHALALADQSTPCTLMECGTWPRAILAGFGRSGHMAGDFVFLHSVALDSKGNLFTGETINGRRIQKFTPRGELNERELADFRPSGYPDVTLKHYDARDPNADND
jgi:hypothetical protein